MSRTLSTTWLIPTGLPPRAILPSGFSRLRPARLYRRAADEESVRPRRPLPERRADHQPDKEEDQEADDAQEEQDLRDARGGRRDAGEAKQRGDQRHHQ